VYDATGGYGVVFRAAAAANVVAAGLLGLARASVS